QPGESNFSWTVAYGGLSGSSALFLYSPVPPGPEGRFATYQVDVPETAIYTLWSREFALDWASPSLWRFDDQLWKRADGTTPAIDPVVVSGENHVYSWYRYGKVLLEAGTHTLQIKVTEPRTLGQSSSTDGLYLKMMDAFLLTSDSTVPLGIIPPAGTLPAQIPPSSLQLTVESLVTRSEHLAPGDI
ncbi:MAG: hypothetical protein M1358_01030, partial [Chloroflexi bacterium]|nr:hypothetical protein [Chloroflexota bacterium]